MDQLTHGNALKPSTLVVQRARSASLREPFAPKHPPQSSLPPWHPRDVAWLPLAGSSPVTLEARTGCKWPINLMPPYLYCNNEISHRSYCAVHAKMAKSKTMEAPE